MSRKDAVFYPRVSKKPPFSVEAPGYQPVKGETIPRRNPVAKDKLLSRPAEDVTTTYDILRRGADKFGNAKAVGSRRLLKTHVENKKFKKVVDGVEQEVDKKWTYFELSEYTYMSFIEYEQLALQLGAGLRKLGLETDSRIHQFGATRQALPRMFKKKRLTWYVLSAVQTGWRCPTVCPSPGYKQPYEMFLMLPRCRIPINHYRYSI
jgi:long-chain acyl-CoA synthetase